MCQLIENGLFEFLNHLNLYIVNSKHLTFYMHIVNQK